MTDPYKQADRARWLRDLLCGALIGAGAILPASPAACWPWCSTYTAL